MPEDTVQTNSAAELFGPIGLLNSGLNVNALRTNALLRHEEWLQLDAAVVDVARKRLVGIADLQAAGLVHDLGGLGTTITMYEKQSDMDSADVDMDGETAGSEDAVAYSSVQIPVPITHKNFRINIRKLESSRKLGESLDTVQARVSARKVAEMLETTLFTGNSSISVNGQAILGYTNAPNANTASGALDWGTIANIYTKVAAAVAANEADSFYGPYILYVSTVQFGQMRAMYDDGTTDTAYDRMLRIFPQITAIKPADYLTDAYAVLVQMEPDVVDLAVGLDFTTVQWETRGGMSVHFKVMAAMVPRVKSDYGGKSGICVISGI